MCSGGGRKTEVTVLWEDATGFPQQGAPETRGSQDQRGPCFLGLTPETTEIHSLSGSVVFSGKQTNGGGGGGDLSPLKTQRPMFPVPFVPLAKTQMLFR